MRHNRTLLLPLLCLGFVGSLTSAPRAENHPEKYGKRLQRLIVASPVDESIVAWVFLTDKGNAGKSGVRTNLVSERSLARRAKVLPAGKRVDVRDLPLATEYIHGVSARVQKIRRQSKWLNAISIEATPEQMSELAALDYVREIRLLARFRRGVEPEVSPDPQASPAVQSAPQKYPRHAVNTLDYGPSFAQLEQMGVPTLHAQGYVGQGVLIGHFDNGYRLLSHEAFDSLQVLATHDFVDGDIDPAPEPSDPSSYGAHGIVTLSTMAGFKEGQLIGPAYGATVLLARTENDASETPLEEDNWVAALEWADSLGVDVISTSLVYLTFDNPFPDWTWQDMDGNTTVITRAADIAVSLGIVVVNSAGNSGLPGVGVGNSLSGPADGDSVLTIGSVTSAGERSSFSSVGPTFDGRIKPDLMAQGSATRCAFSSGPTAYGTASGTSLSCPLVAGVVAQLLSARPTATPMLIRDALRLTASQSQSPDSLMGWGIVNAVAALAFLDASASEQHLPVSTRLTANLPNPFNPVTTISYELAENAHVTLRVFDVRGQLVRTLVSAPQVARRHQVIWDGRRDDGRAVASGIYFARLRTRPPGGSVSDSIRKMTLVR